jgi:hypothetical protein
MASAFKILATEWLWIKQEIHNFGLKSLSGVVKYRYEAWKYTLKRKDKVKLATQ